METKTCLKNQQIKYYGNTMSRRYGKIMKSEFRDTYNVIYIIQKRNAFR